MRLVNQQPDLGIDEAALLQQAVRGDEDAFDRLLEWLLPAMFRQAMKVLGNESDAEDIVQEASLRIFRSIRAFKGDASVKTWATRITLNCCYDLFRTRKNTQHLPLEIETDDGPMERVLADPGQSPLDRLETKDTIRAVREAALSLKEPYRTTLIAIDLLQRSYDEVASELGVPLGTIKSRLSRARAMAAAYLQKTGTKRTGHPSKG